LVGHSSGEIACAFAAGFISAEDAICIAYYRGFHSKHAGLGAMMAVGTSAEDAQELLVFPEFKGRACLAAVNSPTSVTISGDPDAICELQVIFQDEKKFTRILKIKTAYHSHHILSCSDPYIRSLAELNVEVSQGQQAVWYSSSDGVSDVVDVSKVLSSDYWNDNMIQPVYFMQAVQRACTAEGGFDLVVEVGPHPALKGPCLETLGNAKGEVPYTGLFHRGSSAVQSMAGALGFVMSHLGEGAVHIHRYNELLSGNSSFSLIKNLPTYSWNREKRYWHESRLARAIRMRQQPVHELLGHVTPDSSSCEMRWRGLLRPVDIPWIMGHRLHGQTVFPASGYVVMALEAAIALSQPAACGLIEIFNMDLVRALTFDQDTTAMEIIFSVTNITRGEDVILEADFTCTGALMYGHDELRPLATGKIQVLSTLNEKFPSHLEVRDPLSSSLVEVPKTKFYSALEKIGYNYNGPFAALENMKRKLGAATGAVRVMAISNLIIHPAVLDAVFQSAFLNYAAPGDRRLLSVHVPRRINSVIVDPGLCESIVQDTLLLFDSMMQLGSKTAGITSGVNVYSCEGTNAMIHVQGLHCVPLVQGSTSDDVALFSEVVWDAAAPNIEIIDNTGLMRLRSQNELSAILERMAIVYLRTLQQNVPSDHKAREKGPYQHWFHFASTALSRASAGELPSWQSEWENDTLEEVENALIPYSSIIDVQLLRAVGQNIVDIATGAKLPVEVGIRDGLLARYYSNGYGLSEFTELLARTVRQIVHRSPNMNIVELGGGTGAVTKAVLDAVGDKMSSYTFTDISSTFLDSARQFYHGRDGTMAFQRLDIDQDPRSQGFKEHSYDLVIASLVLHATPSLKQAVRNARLLLKPGGYLVALELKPTQYIHYGVIFGAFPGWWLGTDEGRISSPAVNLSEWNDVLQKSGFSGCDTVSPELKDVMTPVVLFVSQAVDSKVNFLRNPLSTSVRPFLSDSVWHQLIIVGGRDIGTSGLMQEVGSLLNGRFEKVTSFPSFPDLFRSRELSSETTVLSLVDLDQNILENIDQETWDGLRSTLLDLGTLIWVTCGRRRNNPFSSAIIGLVRSTAREITSLDYFFLDFESSTSVNARSIAESVLRYKATKYWNSEGNLTAAPETEMTLNCQSLFLIPRLVPSQPMNDRYNSSRRLITANSDIADLQASRTGMHIVLERVPPPSYFDESSSTMETTHSLVSAIRVSEYSFMFLSLAKDSVTDQRQVVLSSQNASASQPYIGELAVPLSPCPGNESSLLILVAHHIMASLVLEGLSEGDTILIHDAGHDLARVLSLEAASQGVEATFSITRNDKKREGLRVHTFQFHALDLTVSQSLLNKTTVFINCEKAVGNRSLGKLIASSLPAHCKKLDMDYVFMAESCPPRGSKAQAIKERLEQAVLRACDFLADEQRNRDTSSISTTVFPVSDVDKETPLDAIMDWKSKSSAKIKLNPAESLIKFSGKKTFWLVGLTGGLGLSLCEWMIHHGARHVMLSSRNPQVDPSWLAAMNGLGASVRVASWCVYVKCE
jgi:hybrid polyketide synthase/nonribosomal peptide synthetase ACE1